MRNHGKGATDRPWKEGKSAKGRSKSDWSQQNKTWKSREWHQHQHSRSERAGDGYADSSIDHRPRSMSRRSSQDTRHSAQGRNEHRGDKSQSRRSRSPAGHQKEWSKHQRQDYEGDAIGKQGRARKDLKDLEVQEGKHRHPYCPNTLDTYTKLKEMMKMTSKT